MPDSSLDVHRQTCQKCQSIDVRNIIVRGGDSPTQIYVRCAKCKNLVAFYELSLYYHAGKGIESFLRGRRAGSDSAREFISEFKRLQENVDGGYGEAVEILEQQQKEI
jgi:hypothetical protein